MSKFGIVNVRMIITEEKILSNISKIKKIIDSDTIQIEENSYFKDLLDSIKTYLIEYPNKKKFPVDVYTATYELLEIATARFEEKNKMMEALKKKKERNTILARKLKSTIYFVENKKEGWKSKIENIARYFSPDIINSLKILGNCKGKNSQEYKSAKKVLYARLNNLETNLHIEVDIDKVENILTILSDIGIEISEALKLIPVPKLRVKQNDNKVKNSINTKEAIKIEKQKYIQDTTFEVKPSIWQKLKNSKIMKVATYIFRIKIRIELPSNALPEGRGESYYE